MEIDIKLTIPDDKLTELKESYARFFEVDITSINAAFIKEMIKDKLTLIYKKGKVKIAQDAVSPIINTDVLEVV